MGIKADLQADLAAAFDDPDGLADAVRTGAYHLFDRSTSGYDPTSGDVTRTSEDFFIRGVFYDSAETDIIDSAVNSNSGSFIVLTNEYTGSRGPRLDDELNLIVKGVTTLFRVAGVKCDPVEATYILSLDAK